MIGRKKRKTSFRIFIFFFFLFFFTSSITVSVTCHLAEITDSFCQKAEPMQSLAALTVSRIVSVAVGKGVLQRSASKMWLC